jgi:hypothetical protein
MAAQPTNVAISPFLPSTGTRKLQHLSASFKHLILDNLSPANDGIIFDSKQEASHGPCSCWKNIWSHTRIPPSRPTPIGMLVCELLLGGGRDVFGFNATKIGTHSLQSGATMALFLMDHYPHKIMILVGRWLSEAFLDYYFRPQVLERTNNMSTDMIHINSFINVSSHLECNLAQTGNPPDDIQWFRIDAGASAAPASLRCIQWIFQESSVLLIEHRLKSSKSKSATVISLASSYLGWPRVSIHSGTTDGIRRLRRLVLVLVRYL